MQIALNDEEKLALLNLLVETIEAERYPVSPRIQALRRVLAKFGPDGAGATPPARPSTRKSAIRLERRSKDVDEPGSGKAGPVRSKQ
jgi:hypothetical protein